jgi:hypothetical protein
MATPKMDALFDQFEIDRNDPRKWEYLARYLADWSCLADDAFPILESAPKVSSKKRGRKRQDGTLATDLSIFLALGAAELQGKSVNSCARQVTRKTSRHVLLRGKNRDYVHSRYYRLRNSNTHEHHRLMDFVSVFVEQLEPGHPSRSQIPIVVSCVMKKAKTKKVGPK